MIPKDVEAYLVEAAANVAKKQGFVPETPERAKQWMAQNIVEVAKEAMRLQEQTFLKFLKNQDLVTDLYTAKTWSRQRKILDIQV